MKTSIFSHFLNLKFKTKTPLHLYANFWTFSGFQHAANQFGGTQQAADQARLCRNTGLYVLYNMWGTMLFSLDGYHVLSCIKQSITESLYRDFYSYCQNTSQPRMIQWEIQVCYAECSLEPIRLFLRHISRSLFIFKTIQFVPNRIWLKQCGSLLD